MVTELSIKSPLPGIDGMWGRGEVGEVGEVGGWGVSTKERGWGWGGWRQPDMEQSCPLGALSTET